MAFQIVADGTDPRRLKLYIMLIPLCLVSVDVNFPRRKWTLKTQLKLKQGLLHCQGLLHPDKQLLCVWQQ